MISRKLCLIHLGLTLLAACGGGLDPAPLGLMQQPIVDGTLDSLHPEVGLLKITDGSQVHLCTATLIGTHSVLTAAHCFADPGTPSFELGGQQYGLSEVHEHPDFNSSLVIDGPKGSGQITVVQHDVALLILDREITGIAPALFAPQLPAAGDEITLVGFGNTQGGQKSPAPTKRVGESLIGLVAEHYIFYGKEFAPTMSNTCDGDSGGPGYVEVEGQERLVSVHSMGDDGCASYGYDMLIKPYLSWIIQASSGNVVPDINDLPTIAITYPGQNAVLAPDFYVEAEARDDQSETVSLELFVDDQLQNRLQQNRASFSLVGLPVGDHTIRVDAIDAQGGRQSYSINIKVSNNPEEYTPGQPPGSGRLEGGCALTGHPIQAPPIWLLALGLALIRVRHFSSLKIKSRRHRRDPVQRDQPAVAGPRADGLNSEPSKELD